ncbi:MAG: Xaa-Pro peptidase family protein [Bryobacteraceae bacterium]
MQNHTYADRRAAVCSQLEKSDLDALLVSYLPNVRYLTGFTGSNALLLLSPGRAQLLTDPRYTIQATQEVDCPVTVVKKSLWKYLPTILGRSRWKNVGIEAAHLTVDLLHSLQSALPLGAALQPAPPFIETARMIKSESEIVAIRRSVDTCSKAFEKVLKRIRVTMTEIEVAAELDYEMRRLGADRPAFDTIVAAGPRSALPHAHPSSATLQMNRLLLIDMGASQAGYASDMTRTQSIGKLSPQLRRAYGAVLEAQMASLDAIRPNVTAGSVDRAARRVLKAHNLDTAFVHSTGHGLGLEIHEPPRLGKADKSLLRPGMVITVEPGVYLPGLGGIRIEDTVLVTETGCEVLTPTKKELLAL